MITSTTISAPVRVSNEVTANFFEVAPKKQKEDEITEEQMRAFFEALKQTARDMAAIGATGRQIAEIMAKRLNPTMARLVMVDLALDLGMKEEAKEYLERFEF